jgi:inorganic pyrophosphatase
LSFVHWNNLLTFSSANSVYNGSAEPAKVEAIPRGENLAPAPIDGSIDKWFFISGAAV